MEKLWFPKGKSGKSSTNDGCFLYLNLLGRTTGGWFTTRIFFDGEFHQAPGMIPDDPNQPIVLGPGRNNGWDVGRLIYSGESKGNSGWDMAWYGYGSKVWSSFGWWNAALPRGGSIATPLDVAFRACWDGMKAAFLIRWKWMLP